MAAALLQVMAEFRRSASVFVHSFNQPFILTYGLLGGLQMRVLLVEDDVGMAKSIELMLKAESFNTFTTELGEEGIDLAKVYEYDIILLDLNLPDMSGYDVLRSLRVGKVATPVLIL